MHKAPLDRLEELLQEIMRDYCNPHAPFNQNKELQDLFKGFCGTAREIIKRIHSETK